jgi:hypothetical protein
MNSYEAKQEAKRERIQARADRLAKEAQSTFARAQELGSIIPFGQPILVGHHSEGRDRRYRAKIRATYERAFETDKAAGEAAARAASIGTGGISSDDPDAIAKLKAELAEREERQATMKAANSAWTKAGHKMGRQTDGTWIDPPNPAFRLSNNSQNMARIRARIATLERNSTRETKERETASGVRIVENAEANRLQLFFPGKPDATIRAELKSAGFRWAPSEGAWQRQLNPNAIYMANHILAKEAQK